MSEKNLKLMNFRADEELIRGLKIAAWLNHTNMSDFIRKTMKKEIDKVQRENIYLMKKVKGEKFE